MPGDRKLWVSPVDIPYYSTSFQARGSFVRLALTSLDWLCIGFPGPTRPSLHRPAAERVAVVRSQEPWWRTVLRPQHYAEHLLLWRASQPPGWKQRQVLPSRCVVWYADEPPSLCRLNENTANTGLNDSHFHEMHRYRVEWEPNGSGGVDNRGYIRWCVPFLRPRPAHGVQVCGRPVCLRHRGVHLEHLWERHPRRAHVPHHEHGVVVYLGIPIQSVWRSHAVLRLQEMGVSVLHPAQHVRELTRSLSD